MTSMTVNGKPVRFLLEPDTPLLWALRDAANLTGTKYGCGEGDCGACMVHVDGEALRSCLITIAEAEGRFITTIEGLSRDRSHPVQQAMVAEQAIQCGYCTPGIVMAASALLAKNGSPSEAEIKAAIPNLCRCGVYPRLVRSIQRAGRVARRQEIISAAPAPGISASDAAREIPALSDPSEN
ncbi:MAG: (2Fe-2S)-binding protein [Pseudomonadota bacterium]|jgi:isoquinoline 1-oxidoreductase alpha subunit|uniref:(2Fe-2S)-binding protein n=2 Tax=Qipengyuania pacifica TaxID=2860199 RepID=A0ABS7JF68_9SPHN|nr:MULTISPECIES: (2Fe-2S)-binding protein [Erythrobacteraceae]MAQ66713.1 isoquinoline 1-oxidoreductase [Sphingomonadaceae bacterium]MCH2496346.1 (2Fe-2S)-binding protein [Erythrobacter sp.]MEC7953707.1 (2Fe-2S)-binding protein [Pseudomonadota bacterium]MBX7488667.1 (2Fe-2S)-binding protein [Qipengyuania aerophila]MEE2795475.1 (2Fe-2S)-binding protein [Pseudomonadota bacterium]|tara:strand:- start:9 stop:554 length:546 start_codon:yes stop_codon:yes gene_type:complete